MVFRLKISKYAIFGVNILVTLSGIGLMILSDGMCVFLAVIGTLMTFFGFLGCCGASGEEQCPLCFFSILMVFSIILISIGGVVLYAKQDEIVTNIKRNVESLYENVTINAKPISELQIKLECCGAKDYMDMDIVGFEFPKSCCRDQTKECRGPNDGMFINISPDELYFPGCANKSVEFIQTLFRISPILIGILIVIQAVAFVINLSLCCYIRNDPLRAVYYQ